MKTKFEFEAPTKVVYVTPTAPIISIDVHSGTPVTKS